MPAIGDRAVVDAMLRAEAALARACGTVGLLDEPTVAAILSACVDLGGLDLAELARAESDPAGLGPAGLDPVDLGRAAVAGGNPVIPLVDRLRDRVGEPAARGVHLGATSQDILDTALMLVARDALTALVADLTSGADAVARLAREHRATPMAGRTLLQVAVPTTFGALAAVWGTGLDRAIAGLRTAVLPAQLGGAAGTLAPLHPHGLAVLAAFSADLGLAEPDGVWHTDRTPITTLAGRLGTAAAAVGKVATDVALLAQTELGEVREAAPGGSSAMAHKQNPIAAITARAAAAQAPGFVATLLAAGSPELQRGAGSWHAEWPALLGLLRSVGGAAARLKTSVSGLVVNSDAMAANLGDSHPDLGHATDLVDRYLERRTT
jgi:3-carboxy-cis,cis-muconate cycloisomerase